METWRRVRTQGRPRRVARPVADARREGLHQHARRLGLERGGDNDAFALLRETVATQDCSIAKGSPETFVVVGVLPDEVIRPRARQATRSVADTTTSQSGGIAASGRDGSSAVPDRLASAISRQLPSLEGRTAPRRRTFGADAL